MMFPRVVTWGILAFSLVFSLADESGQRSYIGVNIAYPSIENYVPKSNLSLVFFRFTSLHPCRARPKSPNENSKTIAGFRFANLHKSH